MTTSTGFQSWRTMEIAAQATASAPKTKLRMKAPRKIWASSEPTKSAQPKAPARISGRAAAGAFGGGRRRQRRLPLRQRRRRAGRRCRPDRRWTPVSAISSGKPMDERVPRRAARRNSGRDPPVRLHDAGARRRSRQAPAGGRSRASTRRGRPAGESPAGMSRHPAGRHHRLVEPVPAQMRRRLAIGIDDDQRPAVARRRFHRVGGAAAPARRPAVPDRHRPHPTGRPPYRPRPHRRRPPRRGCPAVRARPAPCRAARGTRRATPRRRNPSRTPPRAKGSTASSAKATAPVRPCPSARRAPAPRCGRRPRPANRPATAPPCRKRRRRSRPAPCSIAAAIAVEHRIDVGGDRSRAASGNRLGRWPMIPTASASGGLGGCWRHGLRSPSSSRRGNDEDQKIL